ncbi:hypothetical protein FB451DRAFT_1178096 [Mycena latifolia]|nr:hypothetical protein FB451DRAFT_1178096 [Mycena latifolia]
MLEIANLHQGLRAQNIHNQGEPKHDYGSLFEYFQIRRTLDAEPEHIPKVHRTGSIKPPRLTRDVFDWKCKVRFGVRRSNATQAARTLNQTFGSSSEKARTLNLNAASRERRDVSGQGRGVAAPDQIWCDVEISEGPRRVEAEPVETSAMLVRWLMSGRRAYREATWKPRRLHHIKSAIDLAKIIDGGVNEESRAGPWPMSIKSSTIVRNPRNLRQRGPAAVVRKCSDDRACPLPMRARGIQIWKYLCANAPSLHSVQITGFGWEQGRGEISPDSTRLTGAWAIIVSEANGTRVIQKKRRLYKVCGWRTFRFIGSIVIELALKSRETQPDGYMSVGDAVTRRDPVAY